MDSDFGRNFTPAVSVGMEEFASSEGMVRDNCFYRGTEEELVECFCFFDSEAPIVPSLVRVRHTETQFPSSSFRLLSVTRPHKELAASLT